MTSQCQYMAPRRLIRAAKFRFAPWKIKILHSLQILHSLHNLLARKKKKKNRCCFEAYSKGVTFHTRELLSVVFSLATIYLMKFPLWIFWWFSVSRCLADWFMLSNRPLEKLWGGGWGIFEPQEKFFFVTKFLVWIFLGHRMNIFRFLNFHIVRPLNKKPLKRFSLCIKRG